MQTASADSNPPNSTATRTSATLHRGLEETAMDALTQPPASLEALRARKAALDRDLAQHDDLAARLDACMAARAQGNGRMDLPVDIGMGFTAEGVVNDTSRILVSAGLQELFLDLSIEHAREFVDRRRRILQKRLEAVDESLARAEAEHERVSNALKAAFQVTEDDSAGSTDVA